MTSSEVYADPRKGTIYGLVYELVLTSQPDDQTTYIGKARWQGSVSRTMATRLRGHRSAEDVARDPWKSAIAPGAAGWRVLERVRCSGDGPAADEAALRRAESDWIDRRRPLHNDVRPVRPRAGSAALPTRPKVAARPPRKLTPADRRARRNGWVFVALSLLIGAVIFRVTAAGSAPDSAAPWVASFAGGPVGGGWLFLAVRAKLRRITRGRR